MQYNSEELIRIINRFEFLSDSIKKYLNEEIDKNLFYETLKDSCKLSNDFMEKINSYIKISKEIKIDYKKTVENEIDDKIKNRFKNRSEKEKNYFKEYCKKNNVSTKDYFYLYYLISLIKFNEEQVYYFELNSPFGYQGYPLLNNVQKIIIVFSKNINDDYDLNKITKLYNEMLVKEKIDLIDIMDVILNNQEKYKKDS